MFESLRSLSDHRLISRTISLIARERTVTLVVLLHLIEIERRKLHLKRGYPSMFVYCTTVLGYSASAASRRIRTARCIARFPKVRGLLASNQVNLSTISRVAKIMTPRNSDEILLRICGKSQREVEAIAAEYEPLGTVPQDRVRTVVVRVPMTDHNRNGCDPVETPVVSSPATARGAEDHDRSGCDSAKPVAGAAVLERRAMVQFCPSGSFMEKVEQVRHLAAHRLPADASLEQIFELALDLYIEREDPRQRHARREARGTATTVAKPTRPAEDSRVIPAALRDEVFTRDKGQCTFESPDGRRCGSKHMLQIDHRVPVARGGASTPDNLRLLCACHNRLEAERLMGRCAPVSGKEQPAGCVPH